MVLYHGSNVVVKEPKLVENEKGRDFGIAFYLTPVKEHAERWAIRKAKQNSGTKPIVSVFEWNENINDLLIQHFSNADLQWLDMIVECRRNPKYSHGFDIVIGKIADDSVGETVLYVVEGIMRKEDAVERLKFQEINSQVAFCTEKSFKTLKFVKSYEVTK